MKFSTNLKKYDDVKTLSNDDLICYCCDIDKKTIVEAIQNGSRTLKEIKNATNACTGDECATLNPNKRCCSKEIKQLIRIYEEKQ
jgi:NAD(P)H-nitrite reductase large subunit